MPFHISILHQVLSILLSILLRHDEYDVGAMDSTHKIHKQQLHGTYGLNGWPRKEVLEVVCDVTYLTFDEIDETDGR